MGEIEDQLERLAAHRAAQVPPFSIGTADELAVRRRATRRAPVARRDRGLPRGPLVIGGVLLLSGSRRHALGADARRPARRVRQGCAGKAYVTNNADDTVSVITTATGAVSTPIAVGDTPRCRAPDGRDRSRRRGDDLRPAEHPATAPCR